MAQFLHCVVAREATVLCEFAAPGVAFQRISKEKLKEAGEKAQRDGTPKQTLREGDKTHHFLCDGPYVFMALAESSVKGEVVSGLLLALKDDFTTKYGQKAAKMGANSLDKQYGKKMQELMKRAEEKPEEFSKTEKIKAQVAEVKGVMKNNIEKALSRGEKMKDLEKSTEDMAANANIFKKRATEVKQMEVWKNMRMKIIVGAIVVVLLLAILLPVLRIFG